MAAQTPAPSISVQDADKAASAPVYTPRYIDIGINLADPIFRGSYHGNQRHPDDLTSVVQRAKDVGCNKLLVTGSDFTSSRHALEIAKSYPKTVFTTAGIHPCSSAIFSSAGGELDTEGHTMPCDPDPSALVSEEQEPCTEKTSKIISELREFIASAPRDSLIAFGEFGLDYDRLHYCSRKIQLHSFAAQLDLLLTLTPQLPLFLHSRAAHTDFVNVLKDKFGSRLERLEHGAVVHSFTGTVDEARELMDLGLYIGVNGCSFKTKENCDVVREISLDRIMLETDGPWCEVRPSHEGWKYLVAAANASKQRSASPSPSDTPTPSVSGTSTPNPNSTEDTRGPKPAKKPPKKPQKKEPEVPERWRTVKKEKWAEGSMVKGRNEPCMIERIAQIVAGIKGVDVKDVCEAAWNNTTKVFRIED